MLQTQQIDQYEALRKKIVKKKRAIWTIDDWVVGIHSIYGDRNALKSPTEIWLHVANDASQLSEEVRKGYLEDVVRQGAKMFGRICGFVGKYLYQEDFPENDPIETLLRVRNVSDDIIGVSESYGKWILEKYPKGCGTCWETICVCAAYRPIMEKRREHRDLYDKVTQGRGKKIEKTKKQISRVTRTGEPSTIAKEFLSMPLDQLIKTFSEIYSSSHFDLELWKIAAHLMEEIGEVANEILYLAELDQVKHEGKEDIIGHMKNAFEKAKSLENGLNEKLQEKVEVMLSEKDSEQLVAYFKEYIAQTMREELADVISWLSALLCKIGGIWHSAKSPKPGEQLQDYIFWEYLKERFTVHDHLACAFCDNGECKNWCRTVSLTKNVLREMDKSIEQGNIAMPAILKI